MHWVVQGDGVFDQHEWDAITQTFDRFDLPYSVHTVVPFVGGLQPDIEVPDGRAICLGSYAMRHAAARKGWTPGVYDLAEFDFTRQLQAWGTHLLNAGSAILPFGRVKLESERFVRPVDDTKSFTGRVFQPPEFAQWQRDVEALGPSYDGPLTLATLVQVTTPRTILQEVRYWVVGGRLVSRSTYKLGSQVRYESRVDERFDLFAMEMVALWQPLPAFVLDVCDTPEGLRIVEINTLNSAGFYAADIQQIILALDALNAP